MCKLDSAQQSPKSIKAAEILLLSFRLLLMQWRHFYHQVNWVPEQGLFYTGFSLSRKSNFIVEAIVFFFLLAEKRHNTFINIIINSCDLFWTFHKSNSTNREREYMVFSYWSVRGHLHLCGDFKSYLSSGHSYIVFWGDRKLEMSLQLVGISHKWGYFLKCDVRCVTVES